MNYIQTGGKEYEVHEEVGELLHVVSVERDDLQEYNKRLLLENLDMGRMICNLRECVQCLAGRVDEFSV